MYVNALLHEKVREGGKISGETISETPRLLDSQMHLSTYVK
jgi:hypothetical protein